MIQSIKSDNYIEQLIKKNISDIRLLGITNYEQTRTKLTDFYWNRQKKYEYLEKYGFKGQIDLPLETFNITQKIIDKISLIYKNQPDRYLIKGELPIDDDPYIDFINEHRFFHIALKTAERMKNLLGNVLFRPMWYNDKWNFWIETEWIPHFEDTDPLNPVAYSIPVKRDTTQTDLKYIGTENWYMFWSAEDYCWHNDSGKIKPDPSGQYDDMINPFGRLPFVELRKSIPVDEYWPEGANDLLEANMSVNVLLNDLNYAIHFQSYDQAYATGVSPREAVTDKRRVSPNTGDLKIDLTKILLLEDPQATLGLLGFNPKIIDTIQAIKDKISMIAWRYNLHPSWSQEGQPASGFSLLVQNIDLMEAREDDVDVSIHYENEIYKIIQKQTEVFDTDIKALPEIDKDYRLVVDFAEIDFPVNDAEKRDADDWDIENNIKTPIDIIQERNAMTEEEAEEKWRKNKAVNAKYSERQDRLREQLRGFGIEPEEPGEEEG